MNAKTLRQQIMSVLLVLCIVMGMTATIAMATELPETPPLKDELQEKIDALPAEGGLVIVEKTTELSHPLVIPAGKQITLRVH